MKSIKEKAQEVKTELLLNRTNIPEIYEAGAYYVLDEIENVIKSDKILGHPFPSFEMRYNQIISVIEQLKSNQ